MIGSENEREEELVSEKRPHLSYSRVARYLLCPEQYRLYYVEGLRPKVASANLVFGQAVHMALAFLFRHGADPVKTFADSWATAERMALRYSRRDTWEKFRDTGSALLQKFVREELRRIGSVRGSEESFELSVSTLDLPLIGVIDLLADLDGKRTVIDFKTAASGYDEYEAPLSDQLTAYKLAEPEVEQAALCVLVKTKEPQIEWHVTERSGDNLVEYLEKLAYVSGEIDARRFYKRPGKWCSWCDYLRICLGKTVEARETLVRI